MHIWKLTLGYFAIGYTSTLPEISARVLFRCLDLSESRARYDGYDTLRAQPPPPFLNSSEVDHSSPSPSSCAGGNLMAATSVPPSETAASKSDSNTEGLLDVSALRELGRKALVDALNSVHPQILDTLTLLEDRRTSDCGL